MKKASLSLALLAATLLVLPATARATSITASIGNTSSPFVNGALVTSASMLAAQTASPAPFHSACGADGSSNCSASWIFNYVVPAGESVTSASLVIGLSDLDSAAAGNQVALFQVVGGDVLTVAFNAAANALNGNAGSANNEYDEFTFALSNFSPLTGSTTVQLTLQGPGIGVLGATTFNGASLLFSTLHLTTTPNGPPNNPDVPEPATLLLVATGLGAAAVRRRRGAEGARG